MVLRWFITVLSLSIDYVDKKTVYWSVIGYVLI